MPGTCVANFPLLLNNPNYHSSQFTIYLVDFVSRVSEEFTLNTRPLLLFHAALRRSWTYATKLGVYRSYCFINSWWQRKYQVTNTPAPYKCLVTWCAPRTTSLDTTRHIHNIQSNPPQLNISQKALETLPEDGNVMPKHADCYHT